MAVGIWGAMPKALRRSSPRASKPAWPRRPGLRGGPVLRRAGLERVVGAAGGPDRALDDRAEPNLARFTFLHPRARAAHEVLDLPDGNGQRVVVWLPADEATDDAIRRATVGESTLRAV
jgi:hypothetical protein